MLSCFFCHTRVYSVVCPCEPRTTYCARGCHFSINISGFRYGYNNSTSCENASYHHLNSSTKVSGLISVTQSGSKTESTLLRSISRSNSILCFFVVCKSKTPKLYQASAPLLKNVWAWLQNCICQQRRSEWELRTTTNFSWQWPPPEAVLGLSLAVVSDCDISNADVL